MKVVSRADDERSPDRDGSDCKKSGNENDFSLFSEKSMDCRVYTYFIYNKQDIDSSALLKSNFFWSDGADVNLSGVESVVFWARNFEITSVLLRL